jgi:hypothetical protein
VLGVSITDKSEPQAKAAYCGVGPEYEKLTTGTVPDPLTYLVLRAAGGNGGGDANVNTGATSSTKNISHFFMTFYLVFKEQKMCVSERNTLGLVF